MKSLFECASSNWVRYSEYEWKADSNGKLYLTPTKTAQEIQKSIQQFAVKYGLLGLMTALPTTPSFMDYEAVYLPKNHFIREESMWNIQNDRVMVALAMTMADKPMAVNMSFQREYAERYEWIKQQFIDLSFTYLTSMLYYEAWYNVSGAAAAYAAGHAGLWRHCPNLPDRPA